MHFNGEYHENIMRDYRILLVSLCSFFLRLINILSLKEAGMTEMVTY